MLRDKRLINLKRLAVLMPSRLFGKRVCRWASRNPFQSISDFACFLHSGLCSSALTIIRSHLKGTYKPLWKSQGSF